MSLQPLLITTTVESIFSIALGIISAYTVSNGHDSIQMIPNKVESAYIVRLQPPAGSVYRRDVLIGGVVVDANGEQTPAAHTLELLNLPKFTHANVENLATAVGVVCLMRMIVEAALMLGIVAARKKGKEWAAKKLLLTLCVWVTVTLPIFIFVNVAHFAVSHQVGWTISHPLKNALIVLFSFAALASVCNFVITWAVRRLDNDRPAPCPIAAMAAAEREKRLKRQDSFKSARSSLSYSKKDATDEYEEASTHAYTNSLRGWTRHEDEFGANAAQANRSRQQQQQPQYELMERQVEAPRAAPQEPPTPRARSPPQQQPQAHLAAARSHLLRNNSLGLAYVPHGSTEYASPNNASPPSQAHQQLQQTQQQQQNTYQYNEQQQSASDSQQRFELQQSVARLYAPM